MCRCQQKYVRYHFESIEKIEIYKKYRDFAVSANRAGRAKVINGPTRTEKIKEIHLRWSSENAQEVKRFLVFNKHPWQITDSKLKEELDDGVCICGSDIKIYDAETFIKLISNE